MKTQKNMKGYYDPCFTIASRFIERYTTDNPLDAARMLGTESGKAAVRDMMQEEETREYIEANAWDMGFLPENTVNESDECIRHMCVTLQAHIFDSGQYPMVKEYRKIWWDANSDITDHHERHKALYKSVNCIF